MDEFMHDQLEAEILIRTPSTRLEGVFKLYQTGQSEIEGGFNVRVEDESSLDVSIAVKAKREDELNSTFEIKHRGNGDIDATLEVVGSSYLDSIIEVRPNNRMFGIFDILPPPREVKEIVSTEDSTTRSRSDLMTLNYGDSQRMMIGQNISDTGEVETLESFIKFSDIVSHLEDMSVLEEAKLRLYYTGDFFKDTNIELHLPNENWKEYGITHANKPRSIKLVSSEYTNNDVEKYIEFDVKSLVEEWINGDRFNYGFIVRSNSENSTSFYTREGRLQPAINITYITNKVRSAGRSELESTMFVWGAGNADLNSTMEVQSDWGFANLDSTMYVHRYEVPLHSDVDSILTISKPDQYAMLTVVISDDSDLDATFAVQQRSISDKDGYVTINKPELASMFTIDPNASLKSVIWIKGYAQDDLESFFGVTRREIDGSIAVRVERENDLESTIIVKQENNVDLDSYFAVTRKEIDGTFVARAIGEDDLESSVEVPYYSFVESQVAVSRREIIGMIDIRRANEKDATLYVKHREDIEATLTIKQIDELPMTLDIYAKSDVDSTILVNKPDLFGYFYPRVYGDDDLDSMFHARQRDASDLDSYLNVAGAYGAYYFII